MPKTAKLLEAVKAFKTTSRFRDVNDEDALFYREIEELLIDLVNTIRDEPIELVIYQMWEENKVAYRYGNDQPDVRRNFKFGYSPNRVMNIKNMAIRNGLDVQYTPADVNHKYARLTIRYLK